MCMYVCECFSFFFSFFFLKKKKKFKDHFRSCLDFFLITHHSLLNFHCSSPITHHLKYPNSLHPTHLDTVFSFSSLKYFNLFVGPITNHQVRPILDHLKHPTNRRSSNLFSLYVFLKMVAASSSSLSSSSMAFSSAWSPFAEMVSLKPLARWGKDDLDLYP